MVGSKCRKKSKKRSDRKKKANMSGEEMRLKNGRAGPGEGGQQSATS